MHARQERSTDEDRNLDLRNTLYSDMKKLGLQGRGRNVGI